MIINTLITNFWCLFCQNNPRLLSSYIGLSSEMQTRLQKILTRVEQYEIKINKNMKWNNEIKKSHWKHESSLKILPFLKIYWKLKFIFHERSKIIKTLYSYMHYKLLARKNYVRWIYFIVLASIDFARQWIRMNFIKCNYHLHCLRYTRRLAEANISPNHIVNS